LILVIFPFRGFCLVDILSDLRKNSQNRAKNETKETNIYQEPFANRIVRACVCKFFSRKSSTKAAAVAIFFFIPSKGFLSLLVNKFFAPQNYACHFCIFSRAVQNVFGTLQKPNNNCLSKKLKREFLLS
jgi:hypothetical protein